jgi:CheY-like chemotaxis protein
VTEEASQPAKGNPRDEKSSYEYRILVVEDEMFQRLALLDFLTLCKYETVSVTNGRQAIALLNSCDQHFDMFLIDLQMPVMDGFELLSILKNDPRTQKVPVVIMSANNNNTFVAQCLEMGAESYIVKPVRVAHCKAFTLLMKRHRN